MKKVLIHIGASKLQENTLKWAKEAGLYVVATDIDANASSKDIADEFFNISGTDVASLLALSKKLNYLYDVVGVYCNSDFGLEAASEINSKLSLKGCLPKSVKLSLNKLQAKKLMFRKGVPVPLSFTVIEDSKYENLIFPVIVKPADCFKQYDYELTFSQQTWTLEDRVVRIFYDAIGISDPSTFTNL